MKEQKVSGGWITSEYSLLPYSTGERVRREAAQGKISGRTQEIQRLIGRSLRAAVDLERLGERTLWIDCDVLQADGGTRTAAITGAWMALRMAVHRALRTGQLERDPVVHQIAAVSVGCVNSRPMLDLCYAEDVAADTDMNVVMNARGGYVEIQGTAEESAFSPRQLNAMVRLARKGIDALLKYQRRFLRIWEENPKKTESMH